MGLLDFFARKDPTDDWPPARAAPLRFDFARPALNGIAFGARFDLLRVLGKPSNDRPLRAHLCAYAPLGLSVALGARSEVLLFTCVFQAGADGEADEHPGFAPCRISLQDERGTLLEVASTTSVEMVERALGPLERKESAEGHVASKVIGSVWVSFNFDHAGRLALLDIEPAEGGTGAID